jgi:hypothetical protein
VYRLGENKIKKLRLRFTAQEKLAIMEEAIQDDLESTLRRYNLNIESVSRWKRGFMKSRVKTSIHLLEPFQRELKQVQKVRPQSPQMNEKEEAFLRLVASLIVECVLKKDRLDCEYYI